MVLLYINLKQLSTSNIGYCKNIVNSV